MKIEYALMLDTRGAGSDADVGLYDSSFCWITGQGYDSENPPTSPPVNPVTNSPQLDWKAGVLAKAGIGPISQTADPSDGGFYATVGGTRVTVRNLVPGTSTPFSEYLRANEINIQRCRARLFIVFDGEFQQAREFMVDRYAHNDAAITFDLRDTWYLIHRELVLGRVTRSRFPLAPEDSIGAILPLCIGEIPKAKLIPVASQRDPVNIVRYKPGVGDLPVVFGEHSVTRVHNLVSVTRPIDGPLTCRIVAAGNPPYTENDPRLVGKYIGGVLGEKFFTLKILANSAESPSLDYIILTLSDDFRDEDGAVFEPPNSVAQFMLQVFAHSNFQVAGGGAIKGFKSGGTGLLFGWDEDRARFVDMSFPVNRIESFHPAGDYAPLPGLAGALLLPDGKDYLLPPEREAFEVSDVRMGQQPSPTLFLGVTSNILEASRDIPVLNTFPTGGFSPTGSPAPLIVDRDFDSKYEIGWMLKPSLNGNGYARNSGFPFDSTIAVFDFFFPDGFTVKSSEKIAIALDFDLKLSSKGSGAAQYAVSVSADLLSATQTSLAGISKVPLVNKDGTPFAATGLHPGTGGATYEYRGLSGRLYPADGTENGTAYIVVSNPTMMQILASNPDLVKSCRLRIGIHLKHECAYQGMLTSDEYPVSFALREIALFRQWERYSGDYYAPLTGVKFGDTWGGRKSTSDAVSTVSEAIEYLIREHDGKPEVIDTGSFDTASRTPTIWKVGRQVNEERSSLDYIRELLKAGFFCIVPGIDGKRVLRRIDGHPETARLITESDIIRGSLSAAELIDVDRAYTSVDFSYHYNPASDKYESRIAVFHEEEDEFPAHDEMEDGVPVWQSWVIGVSSYGNAKHLWELAHAAWLVTRRKKVAKLELPWVNRNEAEHFDLPYFLAMLYLEWLGVPKERVKFRLPLTPENAQILLMDSYRFQDQKRTGGSWYWHKVDNIVIDTTKDEVELSLYRRVTEEANAPEHELIEETLDAEDVIQEGIDETDTIEEVL